MELFTFVRSDRLHLNHIDVGSVLYIALVYIPPLAPCETTHAKRCVCATVGGDQERVEIHLNAHPDEDQIEARRHLKEQFATFDAAKAQCFLESDRQHLLAVIEAGFGDFYDFNRIARNLFARRLARNIAVKRWHKAFAAVQTFPSYQARTRRRSQQKRASAVQTAVREKAATRLQAATRLRAAMRLRAVTRL